MKETDSVSGKATFPKNKKQPFGKALWSLQHKKKSTREREEKEMVPVRCFCCGLPLANKSEKWKRLRAAGVNGRISLDRVELRKDCCRVHMLTHHDALNKLLAGQATQREQRVQRAREESEALKREALILRTRHEMLEAAAEQEEGGRQDGGVAVAPLPSVIQQAVHMTIGALSSGAVLPQPTTSTVASLSNPSTSTAASLSNP